MSAVRIVLAFAPIAAYSVIITCFKRVWGSVREREREREDEAQTERLY